MVFSSSANGKSILPTAQAKCLGAILWLLSFSHTLHQICQEILFAPPSEQIQDGTSMVQAIILFTLDDCSSLLPGFPASALALVYSHSETRIILLKCKVMSFLCSPPSSGPLLTQLITGSSAIPFLGIYPKKQKHSFKKIHAPQCS